MLTVAAFAQNGPPISVVVDGTPIVFTGQQPAEVDGHVLVPLRGVFEMLGASVEWDPATQSITARKGRTRVKLAIGQLDASVDERPVHMDIAATLVSGTTMVPLRFVSEALGAFVKWNAPQHEVDIQKPVDYDLPKHRDDDHRDRDRQTPPPAVVIRPVPPMPVRHEERRPSFGIIAADTVIPLILNTRLNSANAQRGDQFTATLLTGNMNHYYDLPAGTMAYGSVSFVRRRDGDHPGIIELAFDHLVLPNGRSLPLVGRLVGLDDVSVRRMQGGGIVARGGERHDHVVYSGTGEGIGIVVGFKDDHTSARVDLGNLLEGALRIRTRNVVRVHDVELRPGTQFGVRLYQNLTVPHDR